MCWYTSDTNMYLFLKLNNVEKVISGIVVDNDCLPLVEGLVVAPTSASDRQSMAVNCIPWFKSLAIDAVYIDCLYRDCRWVPKMFTVQVGQLFFFLKKSHLVYATTK